MNPLQLTTAQLLLIHEWCDVAVKLSQEQAHVAEKEKLWEMCAQLLQCTAETQDLAKLIVSQFGLSRKIWTANLAVRVSCPESPDTGQDRSLPPRGKNLMQCQFLPLLKFAA